MFHIKFIYHLWLYYKPCKIQRFGFSCCPSAHGIALCMVTELHPCLWKEMKALASKRALCVRYPVSAVGSRRSFSEPLWVRSWQRRVFFSLMVYDILFWLFWCKRDVWLQWISRECPTVIPDVCCEVSRLLTPPSPLAGASDAHARHICAHLRCFCSAFCVQRRLESGKDAFSSMLPYESVLASRQIAALFSEVDNETFLCTSFPPVFELSDDFTWLGIGTEGRLWI